VQLINQHIQLAPLFESGHHFPNSPTKQQITEKRRRNTIIYKEEERNSWIETD
jgi:hypothetical protein